MSWLGWAVSAILAFGALFLHYRSQEKLEAAAAAGAGHKALGEALAKKNAELEAAVATLRAREKVRNAIDAAKVKTIPDGLSYVRDAFGQLHADRPGSSGSAGPVVPPPGVAKRP